MLHFKPTYKKVLCVSGVVAMLYLFVMLLTPGNSNRSLNPVTTAHSAVTATVDVSASFNTASTIHRSAANRSNHCHFSLRSKSVAKLLLGKGSTIPCLSLLKFAARPSHYLRGYASIISPPGYILFLFRYALF